MSTRLSNLLKKPEKSRLSAEQQHRLALVRPELAHKDGAARAVEREAHAYRARALVSPAVPSTLAAGQYAIDAAIARSFIYRFLTKAFDYPTSTNWLWLSTPANHTSFCSAVRQLSPNLAGLTQVYAHELVRQLQPGQFEPFLNEYLGAFGADYSQPKALLPGASGLSLGKTALRTDRLAELMSFLSSFGLEMAKQVSTGPDVLCLELEFMSLLTAKEAFALERDRHKEPRALHQTQTKFLAHHLTHWASETCDQLKQLAGTGVLSSLARFTKSFLEAECQSFGIRLTSFSSAKAKPQ